MHSGVQGSGILKTEKRTVSSFKSISASGAFEIDVVCQKEVGLEIEGDDNLLPFVKTEVHDDTLYIKPTKNYSAKKPMRIRITVPDVESISASGANGFNVSDVKNEKIKIETSGASNIVISGETVALDLEMSGAGKIDSEKLRATRVSIRLSGAGKATVFASEELNADVSGAGSVTYAGDPKKVNKNISGVGSISKKDTSV